MKLARISNGTIRKLSIQLMCAWIFAGCINPVDIQTERIGNRLVVTGQISTLEDQNFIQLGRTAEVAQVPYPISGASVTLLDDLGKTYSYQEVKSAPGIYILNGISGLAGRTYHVQIALSTNEIYESQPEKMAKQVGKISTRYEEVHEEFIDGEGSVVTQPFVKIYANAELPTNNYFKWSVEEVFILSPTDFPDPFGNTPPSCFIAQNADPQRITLLDGVEIKSSSINNLLVCSRLVDYSFFEKHYFTTYQSSMTKEAYAYWHKVNILANQTGSIFDTPPAEIIGNIYNIRDPSEKAYGYFQAVNQTFDRFYTLKSDLPFPVLWTPCTYDNRDFLLYPRRCLDCLTVRNSSYNRPGWF